MTTPVTHFKLGLFAIAAVAGVATAAITLGLRLDRHPKAIFHTLFDESVQGLDAGAPVKYRGVRIGEVAGFEVAADRRRIDVALALDTAAVARLGLATAPTLLRAELSSRGLTGVKFVDLDFGDPTDGIDTRGLPDRYLPARSSLATRLELEGTRVARSLPGLVADARGTLHRIDTLLDDVHTAQLAPRAAELLDHARATVDAARSLAPPAAAALASARKLVDEAGAWQPAVRGVLARLDGDDGLVASARRATDAAGELGQRVLDSTDGLARALGDLGEAAQSVRAFMDQLDREPDILLKGRGPAGRP